MCECVHAYCVCLQVPWNKLGQEPVIVEFDRLYILAGPKEQSDPAATSQASKDFDRRLGWGIRGGSVTGEFLDGTACVSKAGEGRVLR